MTLNNKHLLLLSDICLLIVAGLWGSSYGVAKGSLQFYPVLGFLAIRFGLTALFLLPFLVKSYRDNSQKLQETFSVGVPLGLILLMIFICETFGVFYTSASNSALLISLCIIITPFMEWLLLKNKPPKLVFICAITSLIGVYLLTMPTMPTPTMPTPTITTPTMTMPTTETEIGELTKLPFNVGDVLILLASLLRAFMVVMTKKRLDNKQISSLNLTAVQAIIVFVGSLMLFIISNFFTATPLYLPTNMDFWLSTLYLVLFCTIFAFFVQNWAVKIGTPSRASLLMGSEPVFGAIFAVWLFGEHISVWGWVGGALITISSVVLMMSQQ